MTETAFNSKHDGKLDADAEAGLWRKFLAWSHSVGLERKAALTLTLLAVIAGVATYGALTDSGPAGTDPETVLGFLYLDLFFLLSLGLLIAKQLVTVLLERRQGQAGSRLHLRLVMMFGAVAVAPTIIISTFSILFFDFGVREWFSERVGTAVKSSMAVAEAYMDEHTNNIRGDVLTMANDLDRSASVLLADATIFAKVISTQAAFRNLSEAIVFDSTGKVLARTGLSISFEFDPLPESAMQRARDGEVVIMRDPTNDKIRALVQLSRIVDSFLYVSRYVDPAAIAHVADTQEAVQQYLDLEVKWFDIRVTFALMFVMVALLLLLASIWIGLSLANSLARPVSALIGGAERVREGDLTARVDQTGQGDELDHLSQSFNRMAEWLESQRAELVDANHQLDIRRIFTEAVLEGVSAGVIGLDKAGCINLPNGAASRLLEIDFAAAMDSPLSDVVPEFSQLLKDCKKRPARRHQAQIELTRGHRTITLLVRIAAEREGREIAGYVVTFDDISELLSAQRKAAWADVARRIAHEIKNPLTPIQLSAERLKRKYLKQITDDQETFEACTDTIVRQVSDIGRMVDEFSSFARMPAPVMAEEDLIKLFEEQLTLQRSAHSNVEFLWETDENSAPLICDSHQIRQAITNLLQNALDAIESAQEKDNSGPRGQIAAKLFRSNHKICLEISDNGVGLPVENRDKLTEPYVTTRNKGTGLGLAIVRKIMEDHGGEVELDDRLGGGATVRLLFSESTGDSESNSLDQIEV